MDYYLLIDHRVSGLPLLYVVRESSALVDQGYGIPTFNTEMIERGPHTGTNFKRDNLSVWNNN
jgi:hypothetical protein